MSFAIESILHLASHSLSFKHESHKVVRPSKKYFSMMDGRLSIFDNVWMCATELRLRLKSVFTLQPGLNLNH